MNEWTKENISIALRNALADEKLIQREVAADLNTHHGNLSNVKNPAQWSKVPEQVWEDLNEWMKSGEKLKGYIPVRFRGKKEEPQPAPAEKSIYDKLEEQHKQAVEKRKAKKETKEPEVRPEEEKKPEKIWDKIIEGKLKKYYEDVCLTQQKFIKDTDITVATLINNMIAKTGENMVIRRFARFQLGEEIKQ